MSIPARRIFGTIAFLLLAGFICVSFFVPHHRVTDSSMGDTTPVGTAVFLVGRDAYAAGDIVTIRLDGDYVTRRLVGYNPDGTLITQGDANPAPDSVPVINGDLRPPTKADIVGAVAFQIPYYLYLYVICFVIALVLAAWGWLSERHEPRLASSA
jgi:hypothetical protein